MIGVHSDFYLVCKCLLTVFYHCILENMFNLLVILWFTHGLCSTAVYFIICFIGIELLPTLSINAEQEEKRI